PERLAAPAPLMFPGKVLADEAGGRLFISDTGHNRILIADLDGKVEAVIGRGDGGLGDGSFDDAAFYQPQGLALEGDTLYVADTETTRSAPWTLPGAASRPSRARELSSWVRASAARRARPR